MAATQVLADVTWDEDTPDGAVVEVDITDMDSLMIHVTGTTLTNCLVRLEGSLNGSDWSSISALDAASGWDSYNSYYNNLVADLIVAVPTWAAAPMKWVRARKEDSGVVAGSMRIMISGGVVGR